MTIISTILDVFGENSFTLASAYLLCPDVNNESVRARIYENIDTLFTRIDRGVYQLKTHGLEAILIEGDGRNLSFLKDNSIDCIITDHPWDDPKSNKGGSRNFTHYDTFQYEQSDFDEKARVLKAGHFLVEFLPTENANNYHYLYHLKCLAESAGFQYYAKVPWTKGAFVANTGRTSKNTEDIMIFSKGKARALRPNVKKNLATHSNDWFMSGAKGMLPTTFNVQPPSRKDRIHQSEKPTTLLQNILAYLTNANDVILDQFAGSGASLIAALKNQCRAIGIEQNSDFCKQIQDRFIQENLPLITIK